jgi:glyoxylase-like metal-dependent hydrolase (beta-lactamase superfamily II)
VGRGERVIPGVWRLRVPLPWPGVPHGNAWAVAAGDGVVLFDCGLGGRGPMRDLERALEQAGWRVGDVRLIVCTHAHVDHCGGAAALQERAGCELWIHPRHEHLTARLDDPGATLLRQIEIGRASGVPEAPLREWAEGRRSGETWMSGPLRPARDLVEGVEVDTDLGAWRVIETPGHAPSHVVLHLPERRLLISGDHVLGRIAPYFDRGFSPDPVGEFLASLDRVAGLDVRLTLAGHARPFTDLRGHVDGNRALVARRLDALHGALGGDGRTAFELLPDVFGDEYDPAGAQRLLVELLALLDHLELAGEAVRGAGDPERWTAA